MQKLEKKSRAKIETKQIINTNITKKKEKKEK